MDWTVDAAPDARGFSTIRIADGTENGDTDAQPIATVYEPQHARLIAAAPDLLAALETFLQNGTIHHEDRRRARAAIAKARSAGA